MLSHWHIPSMTGDFELKVHPDRDDRCLLIVENPTPDELDKLGKFLGKCRRWKWIDKYAGIAPTGRSELTVEAPLAKAGKHLMTVTMPERGRLTAIKNSDGTMELVTTSEDPKEQEKIAAAADSDKADTAVTVKRPTKCCPFPIEGPLFRSSRVLKAFCTPEQWHDWLTNGWILARGHLSGHLYRICHRHHPAAQVQGKICWDLTDHHVIHAYDWSVPPAEEVLAFKLILENHEPWLRSRATTLRGPGALIFSDPSDNGFGEGVWDAHVYRSLGAMMQGAEDGLRTALAMFTGRTDLVD